MNKQDDELREKISARLRQCRKEKGITQEELSRMFDAAPTAIASWEQGRSLPSIQTLYKLSKYYDKTIGFMYGEDDQ